MVVNMNLVSKNIKKLRQQKKFTQEDMAVKLFVTRQTISNWETGKSQPDIETLMKIAELFGVDITVLIYGIPNSDTNKKDKKHLLIAGVILLIFSVFLYFATQFGVYMGRQFCMTPIYLLQLLLYPIFWLILGWTVLQVLGVLGVVKPLKSKYSKTIHITIISILFLYLLIMLPYFVNTISDTIQSYRYIQNPSLYQDGYSNTYELPGFILMIESPIIDATIQHPIIFVIPSLIFWFTKPTKNINS